MRFAQDEERRTPESLADIELSVQAAAPIEKIIEPSPVVAEIDQSVNVQNVDALKHLPAEEDLPASDGDQSEKFSDDPEIKLNMDEEILEIIDAVQPDETDFADILDEAEAMKTDASYEYGLPAEFNLEEWLADWDEEFTAGSEEPVYVQADELSIESSEIVQTDIDNELSPELVAEITLVAEFIGDDSTEKVIDVVAEIINVSSFISEIRVGNDDSEADLAIAMELLAELYDGLMEYLEESGCSEEIIERLIISIAASQSSQAITNVFELLLADDGTHERKTGRLSTILASISKLTQYQLSPTVLLGKLALLAGPKT